MSRYPLTVLALLLGMACVLPAAADDEPQQEQPEPQQEAQAPAACPIAGVWRFQYVDVDGHKVEHADGWEGILVVQPGGAMALYPDQQAYTADLPQRTGWYEIDQDNRVNYIRDRDGDGEISEVERASNDDTYRVQIKEEGIFFVLELRISEGIERIQYMYEPYVEPVEDPDTAAEAQ